MKTFKQILPALLVLITISISISSCDNSEESKNANKPKARGAIGEIILAIDSTKWQGPVGDALKEIFQADVKGLIREESMFTVRRVDPRAVTGILKQATNVVYVTTFDDRSSASQRINALFSKESKEKAASDPSLYMLRSADEHAIGQELIYLFGKNDETLIQNLQANKNKIQNLFHVRERERLEKLILGRKSGAARVAGEKLGLNIQVPTSYQVAKSEDDFLWLRQPTPRSDRADISLFFYEMDYTSEEQVFPEEIIKLREKIAKAHLYSDPDNRNSYLTIEKVDPTPTFTNFNIKGNYAVELRGGWKTANLSMGGSFMSYTIVDTEKGKLYYMEGFVYFPSQNHREAIREIETLLLATDIIPKEEKSS
ncbi:DUF4837 family protein [Belliella kenyensis]|uniref:DUF4837 family protein n=1 Tax=Belliella kenyensis TaxID=1472724 RepID=A0ABV8EL81_9BACT|nr:DUF4837 family protein [Belliella kenyensis]MCH7400653.1 DUF4837 family protein [Belliella kenyensis]MDN3602060.1 DUF4837 family protein [Belliella kenyensis]